MRFVDEFRNKELVYILIEKLKGFSNRTYTYMEVCGGHTMAIHRFGLPSLLPKNFKLISGPGCPVCVTSKSFIDKAIAYSQNHDFVITTFGDLIRVPGTSSTLEMEKEKGADVRIVFSSLDALEIAKLEPKKTIVFLGIGFETTAPGTAIAVQTAYRMKLSNFFLLSAHKVMPPAMESIINAKTQLDGFICPGHVSTITGSTIYDFIAKKYGIGCVVTGFEPTDLLQAIYMLTLQVENSLPLVEIQYKRAVTEKGNSLAQKILNEVFYLDDDWWRGLGIIPKSGLKLNQTYSKYDIERKYPIKISQSENDDGCICGDILRGQLTPYDCRLFASICNPNNPIGACMVSTEGACQTYFRYKKNG